MKLKIYQVDAFTSELFKGNPAAVVPLNEFLPDDVMQQIAAENNLSETVYYLPKGDHYHIRWFTPTKEVKLCGHATLATAFVMKKLGHKEDKIVFNSLSGLLEVTIKEDWFYMNFPAFDAEEVSTPDWVSNFNIQPTKVFRASEDFLLVYDTEEDVKSLEPNFFNLSKVEARGFTATSRSIEFDFVSRFFAPGAGINEDPVTGSAHTRLIPFWAKKLGKTEFVAKQVSERGGVLKCKLIDDRVEIGGQGILYLEGEIWI